MPEPIYRDRLATMRAKAERETSECADLLLYQIREHWVDVDFLRDSARVTARLGLNALALKGAMEG
jgi:hypothetical protein